MHEYSQLIDHNHDYKRDSKVNFVLYNFIAVEIVPKYVNIVTGMKVLNFFTRKIYIGILILCKFN